MRLELPLSLSRRHRLRNTVCGFGSLSLAARLAQESLRGVEASDPLAPKKPHFAAKAQRVIFLFMHGGPSHLETFDPKPDLQRLAGKPLPASFGMVATRRKVAANPLLATKRTFKSYGQSGIEISDFYPHLSRCADDLAVIR